MTLSETLSDALTCSTVSVVICTRNRPDKIEAAVASVLANDHPTFRVVVIDQSNDDLTEAILERLAQADERLTYLHVAQTGLSRAYNIGISETSSEVIAFTDDDCIVPGDWLRCIETAFNDDPSAELLYGQVLPKPAALAEGSIVPDLPFTTAERLSRRDGFRVFGMGANFAARRRLFDKIGGFDEVLGGGGPLQSSQDFDLAYRTFRSGSAIILRPEVTLLHDGGRDPSDWLVVMRNYGIGDGAFYSKHVRCGDVYALLLLLRKVSRLSVGAVVRSLRGEEPRAEYLFGILAGIREGFKFPVDRRTRRYAGS